MAKIFAWLTLFPLVFFFEVLGIVIGTVFTIFTMPNRVWQHINEIEKGLDYE